jgi:Ca2+-binding EF-hand superfamily protein
MKSWRSSNSERYNAIYQKEGYDTRDYQGRFISVREDAKEILEKHLGIPVNTLNLGNSYRPLTSSINYDNLSASYNKSKRLMSTKPKTREMFANPVYRSSSIATSQQARPMTAGSTMDSTHKAIQNPLSIRFKSIVQPTSQKIADTRVKSIVKKRLGLWMREQSLQPIDAFFKILTKELGENVTRLAKVDRDLFSRCLLLLDIGIDEKSAQKYCEDLADKEGKIDASSFIRNISDEDKDDLNHIRDIIYLNGLKFEDILKTMDITKETADLDMFKISKGINRMDPKMAKSKADQIAYKILNGRETINIYDLVESLEGISQNDHKQDIESNISVLRKLRIRLLDNDNPNMLFQEFEKVDEQNNGLLDSANFKTCLLKLKKQLELTIGEINRIARYEPKTKNGEIDYLKFLNKLDLEIINLALTDANALNNDSLYSLKELRHEIKDYLSRYKLTPLKFLAMLQGGNSQNNFTEAELKLHRIVVPLEAFEKFLLENVIRKQGVRIETLAYYISKIDVDKDGIIDGQDFEAFLSRYKLIEDTSLRLANTIKDVTGEDYDQKILANHNKEHFYPVAPLAKTKIDLVLRSLRNAIASRNISFREFFTKLDENKDGMISFDEFSAGLKTIVNFSHTTVRGLFAYMDRTHIGMIDFDNFLKVMKKSVLDNLEEKAEDNFDWQVDVIKQIQTWYFNSGIRSEDAFRIIDSDFDQCIGKNDLRHFLQTVLFIPVEEVTSVRIDRLFNLIDQYKKGKIGYEDFRRILTDDFSPTDNLSLTGGMPINKHSFDWRLNARQKMGLYISRKFKTIDGSFDEISHQGARITFDQFSKWISSNGVLDGFNLTEKLLKDLFSDFDPHKKGHLTRSDWRQVFGKPRIMQLPTTTTQSRSTRSSTSSRRPSPPSKTPSNISPASDPRNKRSTSQALTKPWTTYSHSDSPIKTRRTSG